MGARSHGMSLASQGLSQGLSQSAALQYSAYAGGVGNLQLPYVDPWRQCAQQLLAMYAPPADPVMTAKSPDKVIVDCGFGGGDSRPRSLRRRKPINQKEPK